jgi:hypothetical protein
MQYPLVRILFEVTGKAGGAQQEQGYQPVKKMQWVHGIPRGVLGCTVPVTAGERYEPVYAALLLLIGALQATAPGDKILTPGHSGRLNGHVDYDLDNQPAILRVFRVACNALVMFEGIDA